MKFSTKAKKLNLSNSALKKLAKSGAFKATAAAVILLVVASVSLMSNKEVHNKTAQQSNEQAETEQFVEDTQKPEQKLNDVSPVSNEPSNNQTVSNTNTPELTPQEPAPDYSGLQLHIESIEKATIYVNSQPKNVYNFFGQIQYANGPSTNTVNYGECTLRLTKLGRGAYGDFTETAESQGNNYGPTCSFQVLIGRPKLTAGSWMATMTYTSSDGLGKVTAYKGFTVD